jgi:serine/threonine protein phosphatase PrpC
MSRILCAAASDRGLVRQTNEDAFYAGDRLIAVADGIGGLPAGEVASDIAIGALAGLDADRGPAESIVDKLRAAVEVANQRIGEAVTAQAGREGMGTTLTALLFDGERATLVHIGDSRAYLLRNGNLTQLTRDDTYVQGLVDRGAISADEAARHPHRSLVTQALQGDEISPAFTAMRTRTGDRFLLCSDGLTDVVDDPAIGLALREPAEPSDCAGRLIKLALAAGGPDNVTVIVADVQD